MRRMKTLGTAILMGVVLIALSGCMKEGPAEKAGKSLDDAADSVGDHIDDAGDAIQDAVDGT